MSRNSSVVLIALALLVVIGAGGVFFAMKEEANGGVGSNQEACELLTLEEAKSLLNDTAKKSASGEVRTEETDNLKITNCNYVTQGSGLSDVWTVNLEVRSAKTGAGAADNASYFPPNNTEGQQVAGYGDEALWDAYSGQLTVLQDNNFYLVSMTKGFGGNTVTLSDVQQAAEAVGVKN
jgi:hypothetical protein